MDTILQIELTILVHVIELENAQFSIYPPQKIINRFNNMTKKIVGAEMATPKKIEIYLNKLQKIKIIAKFYTKDKDYGRLVYYKINHPIQKCYSIIKEHYI
ncbi:plasmid maintenance protein [Borreliella bavariensis]|uniref:plasmid maintenance protein n=1 Tax=Borreliella bavariensis TaxID=664662 RepID=UPI001CB6CE0A|nr:plasmid maintenance protein [Borreliella bavariensis]